MWTESRGEPEQGQRQVVEVILNRVASPLFPNTIDSVIQQPNQFATSKAIVPESFKLKIKTFIYHYKPSCYLYFLNPKTATNKQMLKMSKYGDKIGNQIFF